MLKNIAPSISPELLKTLDEMGHGDEIVLADANFPCVGCPIVIRLDGVNMLDLLPGILELMPLDPYTPKDNFALMATTHGDPTPEIWAKYQKVAESKGEGFNLMNQMERYAFYERAKKAHCVVITGEKAVYANIILKKGVVHY
jgi:L-fucose mutarotase